LASAAGALKIKKEFVLKIFEGHPFGEIVNDEFVDMSSAARMYFDLDFLVAKLFKSPIRVVGVGYVFGDSTTMAPSTSPTFELCLEHITDVDVDLV
jgi:hypothetical protein